MIVIHTQKQSITHMQPGKSDHYHRWRLPQQLHGEVHQGDVLAFVERETLIARATASDVRHGHVWFPYVEPCAEPFRRERKRAVYVVDGSGEMLESG